MNSLIDLAAQAVNSTQLECSLYGIVPGHLEPLLRERLIALCGGLPATHPFLEHEIGFVPANETPDGVARNDDIILRLNSQLDPAVALEAQPALHERKWVMIQYGKPESANGATIRPAVYANVDGGDVFKFMRLLGYTFGFEHVRRGYCWGGMYKIVVSQVYKLTERSRLESARTISAEAQPRDVPWLVEVVSQQVPHESAASVANLLGEVRSFLAGVVELEPVDHLYLRERVRYMS
ncbi:hypothetical protein GQ42DRAFT_149774 [Ramicandelaber brevisporus]|nr:hypothetical protein GQ42DRAFT_149774 [Ramicandelaber brevisporus]